MNASKIVCETQRPYVLHHLVSAREAGGEQRNNRRPRFGSLAVTTLGGLGASSKATAEHYNQTTTCTMGHNSARLRA